MDYKQYDGILTCSGDGIIHEVLNAILKRDDKDDFLSKVPLGVIPGGTSNGYSKSVCDESKEECNPESCAYIIAKGEDKLFDIMEVELRNSEKVYSLLSISWGIIADIDLESEV